MNTSSGNFSIRRATELDAPTLEALIELSVRTLLAKHYSAEQLAAALGPVFGLDRQLVRDGTYFVVENDSAIVGCGGWSRRRAVYGGDRDRAGEDAELSPASEAARVRAFFVHPQWERRGIGRLLLHESERAIRAAGFKRIELVATLAGEPLYLAHGYLVTERGEAPLPGGLSIPTICMFKRL